MIFLNIIFGLIFIYFAYLNINDPDAWLWVTIYMVGSASCLAAAFGFYFPYFYLVISVLYLMYAIFLFFTKDGVWDWFTKYKMQNIAASMQASKPWIEKTREFFGLLILCGLLLVNYFLYA